MGTGTAGARQVGERGAGNQRAEVGVPIGPARDFRVRALAGQWRRLVGLGGAAVGVAENVEIGAVEMRHAMVAWSSVRYSGVPRWMLYPPLTPL